MTKRLETFRHQAGRTIHYINIACIRSNENGGKISFARKWGIFPSTCAFRWC